MAREYTREIYLYINGKQISNDIKTIRAEMQLLINEQARMIVGSKEYVAHGEKIRSLKGILNEHTLQLKNMSRSWKETMGAMGDWFNRFQAVGVAAIAAIVGVVMAFRKTTEASNLLEERMSNLSALTGLTGRSLNWLGEKAKESSISITETGVRIKQSASDIVDAYTKIGSQRPELLKNKESLAAVTEAAIILSEAAKSKLEPATLALTTTMNQFNLEASEVNRIINTLAAGSLVGAGEIPYLTEVLEKSGTTANLMGISIEQMTGIIEGIAPKFQMAEVAGTALDRVFLEIRKRGIGFKDGVFDINRAIDELSSRYKNGESAVKIFGVHQAKMGEVLVMNRDAINRFTEGVTGTKVAFEQAGKNTDNMAAKLAQAKNKVTLMYIEIGEKLAPALIVSTNGLNYLLKALMALPKFISENQVAIFSLAVALLAYNAQLIVSLGVLVKDTAFKISNALVTRLSGAATLFNATMIARQVAQTTALTFVQRAAILVQVALNAVQKANPIGLVIAGLTALVAGIMYYNKHNAEYLELEKNKKELADQIIAKNDLLKKTYDDLNAVVARSNFLSREKKQLLIAENDAAIRKAENELVSLQKKRDRIYNENNRLTIGQGFIPMTPEKEAVKSEENAKKAVVAIDEALANLRDRIIEMKGEGNTLQAIINAESEGDKIGDANLTMMEEKMRLYTIALKDAIPKSEDFYRIQKKIKDLDNKMANVVPVEEDGKFKRKEELSDIEEYHNYVTAYLKERYNQNIDDKSQYLDYMDQEEILYLQESIKRLREHGQDTSEEENKIQDIIMASKEAGQKVSLESSKQLYEDYNAFYEKWDEDTKKAMKEAGERFKLPDAYISTQLELDYWRKTTYEGQMALFKKELDEKVIGYSEYTDKIKALDAEVAQKQFQELEDWARGSNTLIDAVATFYEASKNRELKQAGLTDKQKAAIERKYAERQRRFAIAQTIIEGVMEIARVNSNAGVNADLTQALRIFLTAAAAVRTTANVALITSQQFSKGKYPVVGASDGRTYQASLMGRVKTGFYSKPTLGLFAEREPEIVIDGPTTRNLRANFPGILSAINSARVNQYAGGMYPGPGSDQGAWPADFRELLVTNIKMMQQVQASHQRPAVVSFQSLRERQEEFDGIRRKTTVY